MNIKRFNKRALGLPVAALCALILVGANVSQAMPIIDRTDLNELILGNDIDLTVEQPYVPPMEFFGMIEGFNWWVYDAAGTFLPTTSPTEPTVAAGSTQPDLRVPLLDLGIDTAGVYSLVLTVQGPTLLGGVALEDGIRTPNDSANCVQITVVAAGENGVASADCDPNGGGGGTPVSEPSLGALFGLAAAGFLVARRRRRS